MDDMVLGFVFDDATHKVMLTHDGSRSLLHLPKHPASTDSSHSNSPLWTGVYGEIGSIMGMEDQNDPEGMNEMAPEIYLSMTQAFYDHTQVLIPANAWILMGVIEATASQHDHLSQTPSAEDKPCRVYVFSTTWDLTRVREQRQPCQMFSVNEALGLWLDPLAKSLISSMT